MSSVPRETLKRLRKLVKLAKERPDERFSVSVTRLTVLKKMCEERDVALVFTFYMAKLAFAKAQQMETSNTWGMRPGRVICA